MTCFFEEEVSILCTNRVNSDERSDADESWEGGVFGELQKGGELRIEEWVQRQGVTHHMLPFVH